MKLLCTESDTDVCGEIIRKLANAGIEAETKPRAPSLFDPEDADQYRELHEIWVVDDGDAVDSAVEHDVPNRPDQVTRPRRQQGRAHQLVDSTHLASLRLRF